MKTTILTLIAIIFVATVAGCISPDLRTARIAMNEKAWDRAMTALEKELQAKPNNAEALWRFGRCYEQLRNWQNMSNYYDKSLQVSEMFKQRIEDSRLVLVREYLLKSDAKSKADDFNLALTYSDTALIIDPHNIELYRNAAVVAFNGEMLDIAMQHATRAIDMESEGDKDINVRKILLAVNSKQKNSEESLKWARDLMSLVNPHEEQNTYMSALDAIVEAYEGMNESAKAEEMILKAIEFFPENVDLKMNLAVLKIHAEDLDGAAEVYLKVIALDPDNFDANLNLGTILLKNKKWLEAIPYLENTHKQNPENLAAMTNLIKAYYESGQEDKGKEMVKKLEALSDGDE